MESHNKTLNTNIKKKIKFYRFCELLYSEEKWKARQLNQLLSGMRGVFDNPKMEYVKRSKVINDAQQSLRKGKITVDQFLLKVSSDKKKDLNYNGNSASSEDESDDEGDKLCFKCKQNPAVMCMKPCMHAAYCSVCYLTLWSACRAPDVPPCPVESCEETTTGFVQVN